MTVADLRVRMSQAEFVQWHAWYALKGSRERLAAKRRR